MRRKQTSKNQANLHGGEEEGRSRKDSDVRDVYTVTTLNPKQEEEKVEPKRHQPIAIKIVQPSTTTAESAAAASGTDKPI